MARIQGKRGVGVQKQGRTTREGKSREDSGQGVKAGRRMCEPSDPDWKQGIPCHPYGRKLYSECHENHNTIMPSRSSAKDFYIQ